MKVQYTCISVPFNSPFLFYFVERVHRRNKERHGVPGCTCNFCQCQASGIDRDKVVLVESLESKTKN